MRTLYFIFMLVFLAVPLSSLGQQRSLVLDGGDDYVRVDNFLSNSPIAMLNTFTIEAWVNPRSTTGVGEIIELWSDKPSCGGANGGKDRVEFRIFNGLLELCFYDCALATNNYQGILSTDVIPTNVWTHVAVVKNGTTTKLYVNGMLQSPRNDIYRPSGTQGVILSNPIVKDMNIGGSVFFPFWDAGNRFNGEVDEIRFWNVARTQNEIRENMHLTLSVTASLRNYYKMNESSGNLIDVAGSKSGILTNGAYRNLTPLSVDVGASRRLTISSTGVTSFSPASLDVNFNAITAPSVGTDEFVAYRLDGVPYNNIVTMPSTSCFWILRRFGTQTFSYNNLVFYLLSTDFFPSTALIAPNAVRLFNRVVNSGASWNDIRGANSVSNAPKIADFSFSSNTYLGEFTIGIPDIILPMQILSFDAKRQAEQILLKWQVLENATISHFEVEKSYDGIVFKPIGNVSFMAQKNTYNLLNNESKACYFRLKIQDKSGKTDYSKMVFISSIEPRSSEIFIYPNPFYDQLKVEISDFDNEKTINIQINNVSGANLFNGISTKGNIQDLLNKHLQSLPKGIYILVFGLEDKIYQYKLMKN